MLRKREEIKREHERAVADKLLKALEIDASFDKHGDPDKREPDLIYKIGGKTIGIEVTTAYYQQDDAKDSAEIATEEKSLRPDEIRPRSRGIFGSPDQKICDSVQAAIPSVAGHTLASTRPGCASNKTRRLVMPPRLQTVPKI